MNNYSSNYVGRVPVINGVPHSIVNLIRQAVKGSPFYVRLFGRNKNRKQFAKVGRMSSGATHGMLRQNLPARLGTSAVIYLSDKKNVQFDGWDKHKAAHRATKRAIAVALAGQKAGPFVLKTVKTEKIDETLPGVIAAIVA